jgi:maleamate amidohydrolase
MPRDAVVLIDLQRDFLETYGRMPVSEGIAKRLTQVANAVLSRNVLPDALPVLVASHFPPDDAIGNYFRKRAALKGTDGAQIDPRLNIPPDVRIFTKSRSSAFSDPEFEPFLRENRISRLIVLGLLAEGSVRATASDGARRGFDVHVPLDAIATVSHVKMAFARLAMLRAGVRIVRTLPPLPSSPHPSKKENP